VLSAEQIAAAATERAGDTPLALLDLAMPRDVDTRAHTLDGVHVVDLETLAEAAARTAGAAGARDVEAVRRIVAQEVESFGSAQRAAAITPTVVALRAKASEVVRGELDRLDGRLPELDARVRAELTQTVNRVVDKLLHSPTVRVKQLAGEPGGASYAEALRELFELDPAAVHAVAVAPARVPAQAPLTAGGPQ